MYLNPVAHPTSYLLGTGGDKAAGAWSWPVTQVKNKWSYASAHRANEHIYFKDQLGYCRFGDI
jgi:hypothetical protein